MSDIPTVSITIKRERLWQAIGLLLIALLVFTQLFSVSLAIQPKFKISQKDQANSTVRSKNPTKVDTTSLRAEVLPSEGTTLPISWGNLGQQMIADGVINEQAFRQIFPEGFSDEAEEIFSGEYDQQIVMTQANSRFLLDLFWAFGLANQNDILENGEMTDSKYGGDASKFASTGGWTLADGDAMNHYSAYRYVTLNAEQQKLVNKVSRGIYRPCCGNSTHFPDCNHGMAMLGLLELMAANGTTESEMYEVALLVNSYWFPQTYVDLATYFKEQGTDWQDVDPQMVLSSKYSSGRGYKQTRQQIQSLPKPASGGGGCGA